MTGSRSTTRAAGDHRGTGIRLERERALNVFSGLRYTCHHCGRPLKTVTVELFGRQATVPCWTSCGCAESRFDGMELRDEQKEWVRAGIPLRFLNARADLNGWPAAVDSGTSLYIHGPCGDGKTTFACALAKELVSMGCSLRFENAKRLITEIQGTYSGKHTDALDRAYACRVLVLDDLGKEQPTPYSLSMLYEVIDARYADMKPMVVTSNFSRSGLVQRWASADLATAEAIASRLCDGVETLVFDDDDRRLA